MDRINPDAGKFRCCPYGGPPKGHYGGRFQPHLPNALSRIGDALLSGEKLERAKGFEPFQGRLELLSFSGEH